MEFFQSTSKFSVGREMMALFKDIRAAFNRFRRFGPERASQSAEPTLVSSEEWRIWRDTDDDKTYLVYKDPDLGQRKVELT